MTPNPAEDPAGADSAATRYDPAGRLTDRETTRYGPQPGDPHATRYSERSPDAEVTGYATTMEQAGRTERSLPCRFGKYELVERIAEGGMGVVYQAREETAAGSRLVALKM